MDVLTHGRSEASRKKKKMSDHLGAALVVVHMLMIEGSLVGGWEDKLGWLVEAKACGPEHAFCRHLV